MALLLGLLLLWDLCGTLRPLLRLLRERSAHRLFLWWPSGLHRWDWLCQLSRLQVKLLQEGRDHLPVLQCFVKFVSRKDFKIFDPSPRVRAELQQLLFDPANGGTSRRLDGHRRTPTVGAMLDQHGGAHVPVPRFRGPHDHITSELATVALAFAGGLHCDEQLVVDVASGRAPGLFSASDAHLVASLSDIVHLATAVAAAAPLAGHIGTDVLRPSAWQSQTIHEGNQPHRQVPHLCVRLAGLHGTPNARNAIFLDAVLWKNVPVDLGHHSTGVRHEILRVLAARLRKRLHGVPQFPRLVSDEQLLLELHKALLADDGGRSRLCLKCCRDSRLRCSWLRAKGP
mmetsp:Transcript_72875/g.168955  ORF Transcript_72875/g.168955 Transcript_72875/m.168955 type:complete len:342 (+) Transcript_72875:174-1199(+)